MIGIDDFNCHWLAGKLFDTCEKYLGCVGNYQIASLCCLQFCRLVGR